MFTRLRSTSLAGGGAIALVLLISGVVAASSILTAAAAPVADQNEPLVVVDTTKTFEDIDGNGIDDDCQEAVVADEEAAAKAEADVDLNGDGTISVSEAAQSNRIGGPNCNHGGYVSSVAQAACDTADEPTTEPTDEAPAAADEDAEATDEATDTTCDEETEEPTEDPADETDTTPAVCEAAPADQVPPDAEQPVDTSPNAHGKKVSDVARSDAVGGKNCNHGGAVSEAAKDHSDKDAAKAARAHGPKGNKGKGHGGGNH
jgi:hypothetical protein